jgi:co-chaperonin GroES (HSP10)
MSDITEDSQQEATQLPEPTGYRMLCALPEVEDKFANGLFKPDSLAKIEEFSTVVLFVLKMGPDCYKDAAKFPTGTWCKEGDFVLVRAYSGTRFKIHGREFRLINDDTIEGVVQDPRGYSRA